MEPFAAVNASPPRPPAPPCTAVMSDLHLSDFEVPNPRRPGWRRYKERDVCGDDRLLAVFDHLHALAEGRKVELILAGDIFDFDTVLAAPSPAPFPLTWLERRRGMVPEEPKSAWKMERILDCHPQVIAALHQWLVRGHTLVFIVGNHDLDLHWPSVQERLVAAMAPPRPDQLTICEFFRISGGDTLVMHGNQLDAYCVCQDPVHPFIEINGRVRVRSPFGNLAGKLMLNGMGYFNPHVESSFIRPFGQYVRFFLRYIGRHQPLLGVSWFWSAVTTLWISLDEGFRPALRDPARLEERVADVAVRAGATPAVVRGLRDVAAHPAIYSPLRVARELWLDRAALLLFLLAAVFQMGAALQWVTGVGAQWFGILFLALCPFYLAYARSCRSEVGNTEANIRAHVATLCRIAGVNRVITGHTHRAGTSEADGVCYFNTGHWSAAFDDVECTVPVGTNGFVWIEPDIRGRKAELRRFENGHSLRVESMPPPVAGPLIDDPGVVG